jgi:hypothetical protein
MNKTLIGKKNYLFLQNDSAKELEVHNNNLCLVNKKFLKRYEKNKNRFLLIVLPNKSFVYKSYLPDNYNLIYRPGFNEYKEYLNEHILDGYEFLKDIDNSYYKTDTHINLNGNYIIYLNFIDKINNLFNLNISKKEIPLLSVECDSLSKLNKGIGDLTWETNLGNQILEDISDKYYYFENTFDLEEFYMSYKITNDSKIKLYYINNNMLIDETELNINKIVDWNIVSKYIFYKKNDHVQNNLKILIFYDSFLLSIMPIYFNLFNEVYFSKTIYNNDLIEVIDPDYVFEFRCERFLM